MKAVGNIRLLLGEHKMIYDKKKGSLLNYIQLPLHVITPYGTYLGTGYDVNSMPTYTLSYTNVISFPVNQLVFSNLSKNSIIKDTIPSLTINGRNIIGYNYEIPDVEIKYGYITVASQRISIETAKITIASAQLILEKQLRAIGNVLEKFVYEPLGQPQYDALIHYFYYEGVSEIENSPIIKLINNRQWYDITDEIQTSIKRENGRVDDRLAALRIETAKMWSYVPGFS
jgi:GH24 family phage-related lysozyme (muramidase)